MSTPLPSGVWYTLDEDESQWYHCPCAASLSPQEAALQVAEATWWHHKNNADAFLVTLYATKGGASIGKFRALKCVTPKYFITPIEEKTA